MLSQQGGVACALASNQITKQQYYFHLFSCTVVELTNFKFVARTQHEKYRMEEMQTK